MTIALARTAGALSALLLVGNALADTVNVGTIQQLAPHPVIGYAGAYGAYMTSTLVVNPQQRTLVTIDIAGIMQAAGLSWLEKIEVLDGGGNQYNGSPGADIDYWQLEGAQSDATISFGYTGSNAVHIGETSASLATRTSLMDAMSGDQDNNCLHFVSLGQGGSLAATFAVPAPAGGSGGGSGGLGETTGGETPPGGSLNLLQAMPGLKLKLSEAGFGEKYSVRLTGYALVPAPGVASILALASGALGRRRRRRS